MDRALWNEARGSYDEAPQPGAPVPSVEDNAEPSPSSRAALLLDRLAALDPDAPDAAAHVARASRLLAAGAAEAERLGPFAAGYGEALLEHLAPRVTAVVAAPSEGDPLAARLRDAARAANRFGRLVRPLTAHARGRAGDHPLGPDGAARAYVCVAAPGDARAGACAPPTSDPTALRALVERWGRP
jgi:uncharacterized protein YyaL (SSP411 family)